MRNSAVKTSINYDYSDAWYMSIPAVGKFISDEDYHTIDDITYEFLEEGGSLFSILAEIPNSKFGYVNVVLSQNVRSDTVIW